MTIDSSLQSTTAAIDIYIKLAQYPVLADRIRQRMREELFQRGVITELERYNSVLDAWTHAREQITAEMMTSLSSAIHCASVSSFRFFSSLVLPASIA